MPNRQMLQRKSNALILFFASWMIALLSPPFPLYADALTASAAPKADDSANNITLDFKEADINTVLRVLSIKSNVNIVAGPEVQGTVTIRLENVPWDKALDVVLRTYDYVYERDGNIIRVTSREKMSQEPVVTQTYVLNYTKASEIQTSLQDMLTERGRIKTSERTNAIVISDIPTNLYRISEVIKKLDKVTPQAYIDSKIIKTDVGVTENMGIAWNTTGSLSGSSRPTTFPFVTSNEDQLEDLSPDIRQFFPLVNTGTQDGQNTTDTKNFPLPAPSVTSDAFAFGTLSFTSFSSVLTMLQSRSNTKVVSNPRIVVLNNQTAKVQVGQQIPLPSFERNETTGSVEITGFTYRDVGVILNVTPHINSQEEILVDVKPEISSQGDTINFGDFQVPSFNVTTAITQVLIRSGETIAIGGLLTDNVGFSEAKVPYLGDLPYVGKLFRSKRQTAGSGNEKIETLFFVTVTMVDTEGQPAGEQAKKKDEKKKRGSRPFAESPAEKVETVKTGGTAPVKAQTSVAVPAAENTEARPASGKTPGTAAPSSDPARPAEKTAV